MASKRSTANRAQSKIRSQPLIAVRDVRKSSRRYARLLEAERTSELMRSDHDHIYDRLLAGGRSSCSFMPGTRRTIQT
jgi:hypothetical protein